MEARHRGSPPRLRQRKPHADLVPPPAEKPLLRTFKKIDLYPKLHRDHRDKLQKQTTAGAAISAGVTLIMGLMFLVEIVGYLRGVDAYHDRLSVDDGIGQKVPINLNLTMHNIPCHELHIDAMDASGEMQMDVSHDLYKSPVDRNGELVFHAAHTYKHTPHDGHERQGDPGAMAGAMGGLGGIFAALMYDARRDPQSSSFCGSCDIVQIASPMQSMVRDQKCCNTCLQVMKHYDEIKKPRPSPDQVEQCIYEASLANPGCNIAGVLVTSKVKGNFHFAPGRSMAMGFKMIHMYSPMAAMRYNITHTVHHLSFGDSSIQRWSERGPVPYPLDGHHYFVPRGLAVMKYVLKVLPVYYTTGDGDLVEDAEDGELLSDAPASSRRRSSADAVEVGASYEFSPNMQARLFAPGLRNQAPGLFFVYDFYPMQITHVFKRAPLAHFVVNLCKIGGGIFVVTGLLDRVVSSATRILATDR